MNLRRTFLLAGLAGTAALAGCAGPKVTDYAKEQPVLELDRYFNGRVTAHGIFRNATAKWHAVLRWSWIAIGRAIRACSMSTSAILTAAPSAASGG